MTARAVIAWPDTRLRAPTNPVNALHLEAGLVADLFDTMYAANGRGLAAPQIGAPLCAFVIDCAWKTAQPVPKLFLNPQLIWQSETHSQMSERCLSLPNLEVTVARPEAIKLRYQDTGFLWCEQLLEGAEARCALHELDHLAGTLIFDFLSHEAQIDYESAS